MFPVMCNKEMYIECRCHVIFVIMSLCHCKLSSHFFKMIWERTQDLQLYLILINMCASYDMIL